jgi:hypothetical protein
MKRRRISRVPRSVTLLSLVAASGCASYSTEGDVQAISQEINAVNGVHRDAAIAEALRTLGATPFEATQDVASVPSEVGACGSGLPGNPTTATITLESNSITPKSESATFLVDCVALRAFARGGTSVEARTGAGEAVLLVASRSRNNDAVVLARKSDGHVVAITPVGGVVETRKIRRPGTCNRMPSGDVMAGSITFFALSRQTVGDVDVVNAPYRAIGTETVCDNYLE